MNKHTTKSNLRKLDALRDEDIDYSDIPEITDAQFARGKLILPEPKESITVRIDKDVIRWFRSHGKGYQTRINAVLRRYVKTHIKPLHERS